MKSPSLDPTRLHIGKTTPPMVLLAMLTNEPLPLPSLTHDCTPRSSSNLFIKFTDDAAVVGLINNNKTVYRSEMSHLATWCKDDSLHLNVVKMNEIIVDLRREHSQHSLLTIKCSGVAEQCKVPGCTHLPRAILKNQHHLSGQKTQQCGNCEESPDPHYVHMNVRAS